MKAIRTLCALLIICLLLPGQAALGELPEETLPDLSGEALPDLPNEGGAPELEIGIDPLDVSPEDAGADMPLSLELEVGDPLAPVDDVQEDWTDAAIPLNGAEANGGVPIDEAHFPDSDFRVEVSKRFDADGDDILSDGEIAAAKSLNVNVWSSLQGIEYLTALEMLDIVVRGSDFKALDLSRNTALTELSLLWGELEALDLSHNTALTKVDLTAKIDRLDMHGCAHVTDLTILLASDAPEVDLRGCAALVKLTCAGGVSALDLTDSPKLKELNLQNCNLKALDLSGNPNLETLNVSGVNTLDLSRNNRLKLVGVFQSAARLTLGRQPDLKWLICWNNKLTRLDISGCPRLCALFRSKEPLADSSAYYPDYQPSKLYIDEAKDCRLLTDPDVVIQADDIPVKSITLSKTKATLKVGESLPLTATVLPKNATNPKLKWNSSKKYVAWVNSFGKVTAAKPGVTTITATAQDGSGVKAICVVTVPTTVRLDKTDVKLPAGNSTKLTATIRTTDGKNHGVKWSSSVKRVAWVNSFGKVTAAKPGVTIITAAAKDGSGAKATCKVTVPTVVKLNKTRATMKPKGEMYLKATATDAREKDPGVKWSSSDDAVATVNSNGRVTAKGVGTATITATARDASGGKATCKVTVKSSTRVSLTRKKVRLAIGRCVTLNATARREDGKACAVAWSTSNPAVALVSTKGLVTARRAGKATITATAKDGSGASAACTVTVPEPGGTTVTLNMANIDVKPGRNIMLFAKVTSDQSPTPEIKWTCNNPKVAKITGNGYTCVVNTVKAGTAVVTATARDGSGALDACEFTVLDGDAPALWLSDDHLELQVGQSGDIYAEGDRGDNFSPTVTWISSHPNVATVKSGHIVAHAVGKANISATASDGSGLKAICRVTVLPIPVTDVTLNRSFIRLLCGDTFDLKVTVKPDKATVRDVAWSTDNPSVAKVDYRGHITAMNKAGTVTITASASDGSGVSASCTVKVVKPVYRALLIGEEHYLNDDGEPDFTPRNSTDAKKMESMLKSVRGPHGDTYKVTRKTDKSSTEILDLIAATFAGATEDDVSLFFIAAHGDVKGTSTAAGWIGAVTPKGEVSHLNLSSLADALAAIPGRIIVLLGTCGSGAAVYAGNAAGGGEAKAADAFNSAAIRAFRRVDPGVSVLSPNIGEFRKQNKFYVLTATAFQQESWSVRDQSYNLFPHWLIEGVGSAGDRPADAKYEGNGDGIVDLHELYSYISAVGDNHVIWSGFIPHTQQVQVYPPNVRFEMFR